MDLPDGSSGGILSHMRTTILAVAGLLVATAIYCRPVAEAQQPMVGQRWEYAQLTYSKTGNRELVQMFTPTGHSTLAELQQASKIGTPALNSFPDIAALNAAGAMGWELTAQWSESDSRVYVLRRMAR